MTQIQSPSKQQLIELVILLHATTSLFFSASA